MESYIPLAPVTSTTISTPTVTAPVVSHSETRPREDNATPAKAYHAIEQGEIEFQGYSADRTFIQELKDKLGDWPGGDTTRSQLPPGKPGRDSLISMPDYLMKSLYPQKNQQPSWSRRLWMHKYWYISYIDQALMFPSIWSIPLTDQNTVSKKWNSCRYSMPFFPTDVCL